MIDPMVLLQMPNTAAVGRAVEILVVSSIFLVVFVVIALVMVRRLSRSLREGNPEFTKDQVFKAKAELLALARKKKDDAGRETEMAAKAEKETEQVDAEAERQRAERESAKERLAALAAESVGKDCPHCQITMAGDEELVICPECLTAQHRVCFDLSGCVNGCAVDYIYEYPSGRFRELRKPGREGLGIGG
jgi:hypothetical protein